MRTSRRMSMGETTSINLRIDKNLKTESEKLFDKLGLNMTSAVTVFLRQAVREQALPFRVSASNDYDDIEPYKGQSRQFADYGSYVAESLRQSDYKTAEGTMKYYTADEILSRLEEVLNEEV